MPTTHLLDQKMREILRAPESGEQLETLAAIRATELKHQTLRWKIVAAALVSAVGAIAAAVGYRERSAATLHDTSGLDSSHNPVPAGSADIVVRGAGNTVVSNNRGVTKVAAEGP